MSSDPPSVVEGWVGIPAPTDSTEIHHQLLGERPQTTNVMAEGSDDFALRSNPCAQVDLRQDEVVAAQGYGIVKREFGATFR